MSPVIGLLTEQEALKSVKMLLYSQVLLSIRQTTCNKEDTYIITALYKGAPHLNIWIISKN